MNLEKIQDYLLKEKILEFKNFFDDEYLIQDENSKQKYIEFYLINSIKLLQKFTKEKQLTIKEKEKEIYNIKYKLNIIFQNYITKNLREEEIKFLDNYLKNKLNFEMFRKKEKELDIIEEEFKNIIFRKININILHMIDINI